MDKRLWVAALAAACQAAPAEPSPPLQQWLGRLEPSPDGPFLGMSWFIADTAIVATAWTQGGDGPGLLLLRGAGRATSSGLSMELTRANGAAHATITASPAGAKWIGWYHLREWRDSTRLSLEQSVGLADGIFRVALTGAPRGSATGPAHFRCVPEGAELILADRSGGGELYLRVTAPTARFSRGSFPLGAGHRASIQLGGEAGPSYRFHRGALTVKRLDGLGLVGRVQGVARDQTGAEIGVNATLSAAGADGSCL